MPPKKQKISPAIISIIVISLLVIAGGAVYALNNNTQTASEPETTQTEQPAETQTPTANNDSAFADGSYTATGNYSTPGGGESITITATLTGGVVTNITAEGSATRGDSAQYQAKFLSGYKTLVVGKEVESVSLSRVSGSSLTSNGFNRALETIKNDAQS